MHGKMMSETISKVFIKEGSNTYPELFELIIKFTKWEVIENKIERRVREGRHIIDRKSAITERWERNCNCIYLDKKKISK